MKTNMLIPAIALLFAGLLAPPCNASEGLPEGEEGKVILYATPDLGALSLSWAIQYMKTGAGTEVETRTLGPVSPASEMPGQGVFFLMKGSDMDLLEEESLWYMPVGREVVVPVMNSSHPLAGLFLEQGLTPEKLGELTEADRPGSSARIFIPNDPEIIRLLTVFMGKDPLEGNIIICNDEASLMNSVTDNPNGIGFCRLSSLPAGALEKGEFPITVIPIDKNGNGHLDYVEQIYANRPALLRGIWIGKYPGELVSPVYLVAAQIPSPGRGRTFAEWIVMEGQQVLESEGFTALLQAERLKAVESMTQPIVYTRGPVNGLAPLWVILLAVGGFIVAVLLVQSLFSIRSRKRKSMTGSSGITGVMDAGSLDIPMGLYYDKTHTWAFMEKGGCVKVGVNDFLQHVAGPFSKVQSKAPGEKIKRGEPLLTLVQDGKQLVVQSPVSGTLKAVNDDLMDEPSLVNFAPYGDGWICMVEPSNWQREIQFMRMSVACRDWLKNEIERFKDFLAYNANRLTTPVVILQEGGQVADHVLEKMGPEVWEEFQKQFIETAY